MEFYVKEGQAMWIADRWTEYRVLDASRGEKLERWGDYTLVRPDPQVIWQTPQKHPGWKKPHGHYHRSEKGGGQWELFGLPEQAPNWEFIYKETARLSRIHKANGLPAPKVLNLFAYTGGASLAAKCAGADVTHLDSVRQVVTWARENMERSGLDGIRWVVEDALKFARREAKRGNRYDGIILDPPAYGHGPDGEKWKLDELLFGLLQNVAAILSPRDAFMVLNLYSNGYSAALGETVVREAFQGAFREMTSGELAFNDSFGKVLPLSIFVRVKR